MNPERSRRPRPVPEDIRDAATLAKTFEARAELTRDEEEAMNQARLKIAFWTCRQEGVYASWENLSYVLGSHAEAIRPAYNRMLTGRHSEDAKAKSARRRASDADAGDFWGGEKPPA